MFCLLPFFFFPFFFAFFACVFFFPIFFFQVFSPPVGFEHSMRAHREFLKRFHTTIVDVLDDEKPQLRHVLGVFRHFSMLRDSGS